ncbi:hypothetical protein GCM10008904_28430 [Paraclostridium ghonii]|uniref:Uncharacterized protein n=1 Tax=Paraclostridium ghonii TaxID=29358 RepID=A0ABU0N3G0_9FIRM|nr:hypothetical protein [Paeniclostridium ghonii]MCM0167823.1 hypothetical protein [Paeniclostridium ghonii]MDQ0557670.1 hypothetical protein [Paeniclostridium ghonii]
MLNTIEIILKILFFILSFVWAGKIMILRSDKQIVINPLLISISAILALLPDTIFGMNLQFVNIALYFIYVVIILFGLYCMKRKNGVF